MNEKFAVLILTHGRPNKVYTVNALKKVGYSGDIFFIVDNEDETIGDYQKNFGEKVIVFDKEEYFQKSDLFDNFDGPRSVVLPARNACFDIAKNLGLDYFLELDDDYQYFSVKGMLGRTLHDFRSFDFNKICKSYIKFLESNEHIITVCFAQNGDYIGGKDGAMYREKIKFKAMNSFFCKTSRPFVFAGRLNEDLTMSVLYGMRGNIVLTVGDATLAQKATQQNSGGLTDAYLEMGTYWKSFYSVMACPSAVTIGVMGDGHNRIHHHVEWEKVHPYILSEKWKKTSCPTLQKGNRNAQDRRK